MTVTITVTDVNEPPTTDRTLAQATYPENNTKAGGNLYRHRPRERPTMTLEPKGDDGGQFRISGGQLFFNAHPDFEVPRDSTRTDGFYNLILEASDGNSTTTIDRNS